MGKMDDVDLHGLASNLGFVLKAEQKEAAESLLRGKNVCAAYGLWKKPDISAVCFGVKQSFQLAKCFSRTVIKIDRSNTTPTVRAICTFAVCFSVFRPFCRFTLVYEWHFVLGYKEKTRAVRSC